MTKMNSVPKMSSAVAPFENTTANAAIMPIAITDHITKVTIAFFKFMITPI